MSAESVKTKPERRLKRGDVREDGKVFWCYDRAARNGERWLTPEHFDKCLARARGAQKARSADPNTDNRPADRSLRRGYERNDGFIFWGYNRQSTSGERWVTPEQFDAYKRAKNSAGAKTLRLRRKTDPLFNLQHRVRAHATRAARLARTNKQGSSFDMLGTTLEDFKRHIEEKFVEGMSWDRMSEIHIDHIIPLSSAKTPEEVWKLAHYTNLQPLWAADNLRKGAKLPEAE